MKVLIQDEETNLYVGYQTQWTPSAREAKDFAFSIHATAVAQNLNLKSYQVFFYFPELDYRIAVGGSQRQAV